MNRRLATFSVLLSMLVLGSMASVVTADANSFNAGMKAAKAQNYDLALDKLEQALAADPNNLQYGSEYRQAMIAAGQYDRGLEFFAKLVEEHPDAPNAFLNFGFAHVDRIPVEGAITQVILANSALGHFTTALELEETWLGLYTRGNSYLFWPAIFGRAQLGVDDLLKAMEYTEKGELHKHYGRTYVALGDGYWRLEDVDKARQTWKKGLELFPDNPELKTRLTKEGEELDTFLEVHFSTENRVDTDLSEIWEAGQ